MGEILRLILTLKPTEFIGYIVKVTTIKLTSFFVWTILERVALLRWFLQHIVVVLCKAVLERCSHLHKQALTR